MNKFGLILVTFYCCASLASFFVPDGSITTRQIKDSNITTAKINDGAITGAKITGSWPINLGLGVTGVTTSSTSFVDVTGLNATITPATGRVMMMLNGGTSPCYIRVSDATVAVATADFKFMYGSTDLNQYEMKANGITAPNSLSIPGSSLVSVATSIPTGSSLTFKVQYKVAVATNTAEVTGCNLTVFDLP